VGLWHITDNKSQEAVTARAPVFSLWDRHTLTSYCRGRFYMILNPAQPRYRGQVFRIQIAGVPEGEHGRCCSIQWCAEGNCWLGRHCRGAPSALRGNFPVYPPFLRTLIYHGSSDGYAPRAIAQLLMSIDPRVTHGPPCVDSLMPNIWTEPFPFAGSTITPTRYMDYQ